MVDLWASTGPAITFAPDDWLDAINILFFQLLTVANTTGNRCVNYWVCVNFTHGDQNRL